MPQPPGSSPTERLTTYDYPTYDYIVVGGGSSGCIAAAELAAEPGVRVLLLETGQAAEDNPETLEADGYKDAFINDRLIWDRFSERQDTCKDLRKYMGSGRGMGGSGSVNGMVYTRGAALDYDEWPEGWRWADLAPEFEALEARLRVRRRSPTAWTEACITAAEQAGFRRSDDLNDGDLSGVLGYEFMNYEGERRRSSYVAFVKDRELPNLTIETGAHVQRLLVSEGPRVSGVAWRRDGQDHIARCSSDAGGAVVMCAGALETPKLLMLSGIGPADELRAHGIDVLFDQPEIGRNFHDHPNVTLFFKGRHEVDCKYPQLYGFHRANPELPLPAAQSDSCYVFYPARSSIKEATKRILPTMLLAPGIYRRFGAARAAIRGLIEAAFKIGAVRRYVDRVYGVVVILGKPMSRGTVGLASGDPAEQARIDPAYLRDPADLDTMLAAVRLARRLAGAPALAEWGNKELAPGTRKTSDKALAAWIRKMVMTTYHYAGTCRMGTDARSVVDARLRLRGVAGLRIADASVVPTTPVSAMNAPSMLVGWRLAKFALEERRQAHGHARSA